MLWRTWFHHALARLFWKPPAARTVSRPHYNVISESYWPQDYITISFICILELCVVKDFVISESQLFLSFNNHRFNTKITWKVRSNGASVSISGLIEFICTQYVSLVYWKSSKQQCKIVVSHTVAYTCKTRVTLSNILSHLESTLRYVFEDSKK